MLAYLSTLRSGARSASHLRRSRRFRRQSWIRDGVQGPDLQESGTVSNHDTLLVFLCAFLRMRISKSIRAGARKLVELDGIEPTTSCLQSRCSTN